MSFRKRAPVKTKVVLSDKPAHVPSRATRVTHDAAATTDNNSTHWLAALGYDANTIVGTDLPTLRNRANYELLNNGVAKRLARTLVTATIGSGPRLQFTSEDRDYATRVEDEFTAWAAGADVTCRLSMAKLLDQGVHHLLRSGEILHVPRTRQEAPGPVKFRTLPIDPARLATPMGTLADPTVRNGIKYDEDGVPVEYYILKQHPGSAGGWANAAEYDTIPAAQVCHVYEAESANQGRGFPWLATSLPLLAQCRRWTLACLSAAEQAANISGVLHSNSDLVEVDEQPESMDTIEIPRDTLLTLPAGWDLNQLRAEHPPGQFADFRNEIIAEAAGPFCMPMTKATGNYSKASYASGRMGAQDFYAFVRSVQAWLGGTLCNWLFMRWYEEALLSGALRSGRRGCPSLRPQSGHVGAPGTEDNPGRVLYAGHTATTRPDQIVWYWPGLKHVDPDKESKSEDRGLRNGSVNLADVHAPRGEDWQRSMDQRGREIAAAYALRVTLSGEVGVEVPLELVAPHLFPPAVPAPIEIEEPTA